MDDQVEARPPHLPDWMTAIHPLAWVFILLAIVDGVWVFSRSFVGAAPDVATVLNLAINLSWSVAACLLPAALLIRHPDASGSARVLLAGAILYAVAQGLQILGDPLQPFFDQLTPPSDELPFLNPAAEVYRQAAYLMAAVGLACIGLGLARARRYEGGHSVAVAVLVPAAFVLAVLTVLDSMQQIVLGGTTVTPTYAIFLAVAIIVGVVRIMGWAYLTAMASRGSGAGEDPGIGWRLAALGGWLVLLSIGMSTVLGLVLVWLEVQDNSLLWVAYLYSGIFAVGHLCLLAGFALGLPALGPLEAIDDDGAEETDEGDDDFAAEDDLGWPVAGVPGR